MNINFNRLFQKLIPFIYIVLVAYILNQILFFYLPKSGVYLSYDSNNYNLLIFNGPLDTGHPSYNGGELFLGACCYPGNDPNADLVIDTGE